jgi:hypothetical protein
MPQRKTPDAYKHLAQERGFAWLGPEVANAREKTTWQCPAGHQWQTSYNKIQQKRGCPFCAGKAPKTPADYKRLAKKRGFRWLGPEVLKVDTPTGWECPVGHQWQASYHNVQHRGSGCPFCAGRVPKKPADYKRLAKKRGFKWLGPEVPDTHTPTGWECPAGHRWQNSFSHIQSGQGCPTCAQIAQRRPPEDYHTLAQERDFIWLGPEVPATDVPTKWQCSKGHVWRTAYHVIQHGAGCPTCANIAKRNPPAMYVELARKRGFTWLGPEVPNVRTKSWWRCPAGHRWATRYDSIKLGTGCPVCAGKREPEWFGFMRPV